MGRCRSLGCRRLWTFGWSLVLTLAVAVAAVASEPAEELRAAETAFAATMASRDLEAFTAFLDDETVFFSGSTELRGKSAVAEAWAKFFEGEVAPFSWEPEIASVLDSGQLGLTSGPVFDPQGERVGTFISTWRRSADGSWKIVFDRGCP